MNLLKTVVDNAINIQNLFTDRLASTEDYFLTSCYKFQYLVTP